MDAFDFKEEKPARSLQATPDLIWNILSVVMLVGMFCVFGAALLIFINPTTPLNPFPPREIEAAIPTIAVPTVPTPTDTPKALAPTWTPAPTLTDTPRPTRPTSTPLISDTPEDTPTPSEAEATVTPGGMSYAAQGAPQFLEDFQGRACKWMGVAGQVFDLRGGPVIGLLVQMGGTLEGKTLDLQVSMTGIARQYGESGYEFAIADKVVASDNTLWVQLLDQAGLPLSDKIYFSTVDDCTKNLILISFKQVK